MAEALAETAVSNTNYGGYLIATEKAAKSTPSAPGKCLSDILDDIRADKKLSTAARWEDGNKVIDGIVGRASDEMIKYASQWKVGEGDLEQKTSEMINNTVYFTSTAQHPPKQASFE